MTQPVSVRPVLGVRHVRRAPAGPQPFETHAARWLPVLGDFGREPRRRTSSTGTSRSGSSLPAPVHADGAVARRRRRRRRARTAPSRSWPAGCASPSAPCAPSTISARKPSAFNRSTILVRVVVVAVGDRQHRHLHRREPRRERARVVLDEHREEPLDRSEQRAVDHDRPVALVVGADVVHVEALRHLEVELDRRHLPRAADRVLGLHARSSGRRTRRRPRRARARGPCPRAAARSASVASSHSSSVPTALPGGFVESSR